VIAKSKNFPNIWGGYTTKSWMTKPDGRYYCDESACLFLLCGSEKFKKEFNIVTPKIYKCLNKDKAIFEGRNHGPIFGRGMGIGENCDLKEMSGMLGSYDYESDIPRNHLGYSGHHDDYVIIEEYEVFAVK